ncbi:MAG: hypothetical protein KDC24_11170 [Saprospiraceae bacterium]|nr:hypothetical protein [Saprospiraceae bacterium]
MSALAHKIYISTLVAIVLLVTFLLVYHGVSYYSTSLEERFYHPSHDYFKPSGVFGHGLGIVGTILIIIGVSIYILKKRYGWWEKWGRLKYWLEFHIFLCTLGPIMILFHTAFKFGGIVSVSFWSMVAVVASGVIGRFIYIQIPRTIEGRELSLSEVKDMKVGVEETLRNDYQLAEDTRNLVTAATSSVEKGGNLLGRIWTKYWSDKKTLSKVRRDLKANNVNRERAKEVVGLLKNEISLSNKIARLQTMQNLFKYWHVAHLPFAVIMLIIMVIHVGVTLAFGYRWIF